MLRGLSGLAETQNRIAPHCPIGFTLQLGLSKSQRDQDPTLTPSFLSFFFHSLLLSHSLSHTLPPLFRLCLSHCSGSEKLIYKSSLLGEEIQAALELAARPCLYHNDMSVHVFLCWVTPWPQCTLAAVLKIAVTVINAIKNDVGVSLFPFFIQFLYYLWR